MKPNSTVTVLADPLCPPDRAYVAISGPILTVDSSAQIPIPTVDSSAQILKTLYPQQSLAGLGAWLPANGSATFFGISRHKMIGVTLRGSVRRLRGLAKAWPQFCPWWSLPGRGNATLNALVRADAPATDRLRFAKDAADRKLIELHDAVALLLGEGA